jgi:hypothetical protein
MEGSGNVWVQGSGESMWEPKGGISFQIEGFGVSDGRDGGEV